VDRQGQVAVPEKVADGHPQVTGRRTWKLFVLNSV
jgi:hypothetical protein